MTISHEMTTVSEVLNILQEEGYTDEFMVEGRQVFRKTDRKKYNPEELTIVRHFRFEGDSDPGDMSVVYVIEADDGTRGILMDAYGTYAGYVAEFLKQVKMKEEN